MKEMKKLSHIVTAFIGMSLLLISGGGGVLIVAATMKKPAIRL